MKLKVQMIGVDLDGTLLTTDKKAVSLYGFGA